MLAREAVAEPVAGDAVPRPRSVLILDAQPRVLTIGRDAVVSSPSTGYDVQVAYPVGATQLLVPTEAIP